MQDIAGEMAQGIEYLEQEVLSAITSEITNLEALVRPDVPFGSAAETTRESSLRQPESLDHADFTDVTLRDGTVVSLGLSTPDPLGWTPATPPNESRVFDEERKSKVDRVAAILARDGNSLAGGIEDALLVTHEEDIATDAPALSPGAGLIAAVTVIMKLIQSTIERNRRSRQRRQGPEEDHPNA